MTLSFHLEPLLDPFMLRAAVLAVVFGVVLCLMGGKAARWRIPALLALLLALLNPVRVHEKRESVPDIVTIAVDRSQSQKFGQRTRTTDAALAHLRARLGKIEGLETQVIEIAGSHAGGEGEGTYLFENLRQSLSRIPKERSAGVILITDGQVHDASALEGVGPVHAILTGSRSEKDRAVVLEAVPSYGVVGEKVEFSVRVRETGMPAGGALALRVSRDGEELESVMVAADESISFSYPLLHGGPNFFEFSVDTVAGELTGMNNRTIVSVNGVRDRLKVLLVSGEPYPGERTWRNLLKSDPSVDLVHFTILRSPEKFDPTPQHELSLIAFPVDELFEQKIRQFDLIIFDRYEFRGVLLPSHLRNIADFVRSGGALLMAGGPDYVSENALYTTVVREVLPVAPVGGSIVEEAFYPTLTEKGRRHPVTSILNKQAEGKDGKPGWGRWFRQARVDAGKGQVLMSGAQDLPLMVFDRVGEGRVAQLTSDHIWLWAKGIDGGGPYTEFLRRLVHWLMKEPELEESALSARIENGELKAEARRVEDIALTVSIETPSGAQSEIKMEDRGSGVYQGKAAAAEEGVYKVSDGTRSVFVAAGDLSSPELSDIESTDRILTPLAKTSGGHVFYFDEKTDFGVRTLSGRRSSYAGGGWIGLRRNDAFHVTDVTEKPLLPEYAMLALLLVLLLTAWIREGYGAFKKRA